MFRPPFADKLDRIFKSKGRLPLKLFAGAAVGLFVGLLVVNREKVVPPSRLESAILIGSCVALTVSVVLALHLKDSVQSRIADGQPVNRFLRLLFASGLKSLLMWIFVAFAGAIVVSILSVMV